MIVLPAHFRILSGSINILTKPSSVLKADYDFGSSLMLPVMDISMLVAEKNT